jgi:parvulin-like peptidyl-prolyl isomerase
MHISHHKKKLYIASGIIGTILVLAGIGYLFKLYPVVMVGGEFISIRQLEQSFAIGKRFEQTLNKPQVYSKLIENKQKELLAKKLRIDLKDTANDELIYFKTNNDQYSKFLSDYFSNNERLFVKYVVEPETYDALLKRKYNSDFTANSEAYSLASNIITRLNNGEAFEEVAKSSDDQLTGQFGGDLGFMKKEQLLPELQKALDSVTMGEVLSEIVISRFGYHILFPVEISEQNGQQLWHVKHILVSTTGYGEWLNKQLEAIRVRKFINI